MINLDLLLCAAPADARQDVIARPKFAAVPGEGYPQRWYGFEVGIPIGIWRAHLLPHVQALLDGPVVLFGQTLRNYGWFTYIAPITPIRSTDQLVWLHFYEPEYQDAWLARHKLNPGNNLTCAPGVREFLAN